MCDATKPRHNSKIRSRWKVRRNHEKIQQETSLFSTLWLLAIHELEPSDLTLATCQYASSADICMLLFRPSEPGRALVLPAAAKVEILRHTSFTPSPPIRIWRMQQQHTHALTFPFPFPNFIHLGLPTRTLSSLDRNCYRQHPPPCLPSGMIFSIEDT